MANLQTSTFDDITLPSGPTTNRPGTPIKGYVRYNTTLSVLEFYDGTYWKAVTGYSLGSLGTGGQTITYRGGGIQHIFSNTGSQTFTPTHTGYVQVLVVAGGGGGGGGWAGGGGGGGMIFQRNFPVSAGVGVPLNVGGGSSGGLGTQGGASNFGPLSATGGGGPSTWDQNSPGTPGGSGGGGANTSIDSSRLRVYGGRGTSGQGFPGGSGVRFNDDGENSHNGGGGGGAGGPGYDSQDSNAFQSTHGGPGAASNILGDVFYWAGGGASGPHICNGGGGNGGVGGGGGGAAHYYPGVPLSLSNGYGGGQTWTGTRGGDGTNNGSHGNGGGAGAANTGGGGGSGGGGCNAGGSGVVIVRY